MSEEELADVELLLERSTEVTCCLYFSNGSWQLRETDVGYFNSQLFYDIILQIAKASKKSESTEVRYLIICLLITNMVILD